VPQAPQIGRYPGSDAWRPCDRGVLGTVGPNRRG